MPKKGIQVDRLGVLEAAGGRIDLSGHEAEHGDERDAEDDERDGQRDAADEPHPVTGHEGQHQRADERREDDQAQDGDAGEVEMHQRVARKM